MDELQKCFAKLPQDREVPVTEVDRALMAFTARRDVKIRRPKETRDLMHERAEEQAA